ncbi:MAG: DUF2141 domain-containing protein [Verrucomicrobiaceae bacterium]
MKLVLLLLLSCLTASGEFLVHVSGLQNDHGKVGLLVFSSADGFPEDPAKATHQISLDAQKGTLTFKLPALKPGKYAFVVLHDENKNNKLDKNFIGYPREGVALSNYQKLARPKFAKAVTTNPGSPLKLKMLYP